VHQALLAPGNQESGRGVLHPLDPSLLLEVRLDQPEEVDLEIAWE
jgi:hypothetical protein